jgi:hypothetical protein
MVGEVYVIVRSSPDPGFGAEPHDCIKMHDHDFDATIGINEFIILKLKLSQLGNNYT